MRLARAGARLSEPMNEQEPQQMRAGGDGARTVAVVGSRANETNEALVAAWRALGIPALLLSGAEARARLGVGDLALGRIDVLPTLDGVEPGLFDLLLLERAGIPVRNRAFALLAVHDKLLTARRLQAAGLPHPRTVHLRAAEDPLPLPPPLVLKPRFGSWGSGVFRCGGEREARRLLRRLSDRSWFRRHGAIAQELVPSRARDLRLLVAGGRVVGAIERLAAAGEWRTNISLGGARAAASPGAAACELALAAAAALGADLVGVDMLPLAGGGYTVLELNGAVDFTEDYSLGGRDVFREAASALALPRWLEAASPRPAAAAAR